MNRDRLVVFKPRQGRINTDNISALPQYQPPSDHQEEDDPQPVAEPEVTERTTSAPLARELRATTERRARVGDPSSWQYGCTDQPWQRGR